ncbi:hypothetical protein Y032_0180g788 [Ancylostoma ceylanicum]|uniref:Uncharacterized protein n=1 Tax=Ancylostoma ceylanicum TaxID=53326 RepID=A0A016ST88_9BILA|nr:hypothetical protein Y032_0180g788 [Ancylostoma ceylanicum]
MGLPPPAEAKRRERSQQGLIARCGSAIEARVEPSSESTGDSESAPESRRRDPLQRLGSGPAAPSPADTSLHSPAPKRNFVEISR